ncbi:MAG: bifunctional D-glycero-beta-D-manno-heptose-7-phosphate kinase/D-glycero-beta-D-manno-heptose 1-phosphate adenylyltransferase HldE [Candidatus Korobacteraceae bacterium]|jgi:D-beta-D-heptose 7-phosphate kinase / D-beta-D-heptose 1-phosphate adenosyltransferase
MIPELPDIVALVESGWRQVAVLVVGDVMLDQYVWGEVERISPEAPVPVLRATLRDQKPGGAANVAMNLAGLGACVTLVGFAGGDREQETLESLLADAGIEPLLTAVPNAPTTTKLRILSGHQQMMRLDSEAAPAFSKDDYGRLLERAFTALPDAAVVVLSDYAKGTLNEAVCQALIREAHQRKIPVLVDPKSQSFSRYRGATAICPNLKELAAATGEAAANLDRLLSAGQDLLPSLEVEFIVVTLGEKGIAVLHRNLRFHAPAVVRQVYDVSGAGDTVLAVLALAIACGVPIETAVQLANIAAGVVVSKVGTVPIQREELLAALSEEISLHMDEKVLRLDRLLSRVTTWRSTSQRVVFTNGCFDILHIGHIRLLEEARRKGDRLIVGLNSDESVRRLKGPLRPIIAEGERARVLAALSAVDAVVVFDESTPLQLIEAIHPDVLVKGGDYTEDTVVGAREVRAWGGRVELIPLAGDISTTRLIAKSVGSVLANPIAKVSSA